MSAATAHRGTIHLSVDDPGAAWERDEDYVSMTAGVLRMVLDRRGWTAVAVAQHAGTDDVTDGSGNPVDTVGLAALVFDALAAAEGDEDSMMAALEAAGVIPAEVRS